MIFKKSHQTKLCGGVVILMCKYCSKHKKTRKKTKQKNKKQKKKKKKEKKKDLWRFRRWWWSVSSPAFHLCLGLILSFGKWVENSVYVSSAFISVKNATGSYYIFVFVKKINVVTILNKLHPANN